MRWKLRERFGNGVVGGSVKNTESKQMSGAEEHGREIVMCGRKSRELIYKRNDQHKIFLFSLNFSPAKKGLFYFSHQ